MIRRIEFCLTAPAILMVLLSVGCRGTQYAHVLDSKDEDLVGTHAAGAETWKPLIDDAVARMMSRSARDIHLASHTVIDGNAVQRSICFVGVENHSSEDLGDFRHQIYEHIDTLIGQSDQFRMISRRYVEAAMAKCRCRPESLILPDYQRQLQAELERADQPFDYILFARITSGTTNSNADYQRDYLLTLELLNIHTGESLKESATLRKGYHKSMLGRILKYN